MTLTEFLKKDNRKNTTFEISDLSQRLQEAGQKFTIKPMSYKQFAEYQQNATKFTKKGGSLDAVRFNFDIILNHCVEPNFKDANLVKEAGFISSYDLLDAYFTPGEVIALADKISECSGVDTNTEAKITEIKN